MITVPLQTKYLANANYTLKLDRYIVNWTPSIGLINALGQVGMTVTICLSEKHLTPAPDCCFVKNWGENEGIMEAMEAAGLLIDTGYAVRVGREFARQAKMNETLRHEFSKLKGSLI